MAQKAEKMLLNEDNKWMSMQRATFSKSLNSRNIDKSVSDIRIRIRFPFESSFRIYVSGCKLTILPDIQPANQIVIISTLHCYMKRCCWGVFSARYTISKGVFQKKIFLPGVPAKSLIFLTWLYFTNLSSKLFFPMALVCWLQTSAQIEPTNLRGKGHEALR